MNIKPVDQTLMLQMVRARCEFELILIEEIPLVMALGITAQVDHIVGVYCCLGQLHSLTVWSLFDLNAIIL